MTIDKIKKMEDIFILLTLTRKQKYNKKLYFMPIKQNLVHFVYQKALIQSFHTRFLTTNLRTQIQKVILYSKNGLSS